MIVAAVQQSEFLALVRCGARAAETEYAHLLPGWLTSQDFAAQVTAAAEAGNACGYRSAHVARHMARVAVERYFGL